jgi:hypothetical protein
VNLSAVVDGAGVATTLQIAITPTAWRPAATANAKPKEKEKDKPRVDGPWLRAQAGLAFGGYHFRQEPTMTLGPIYDAPITWGGTETESAKAPGIAMKAAMDVPGLADNLGARASFRSVIYRVQIENFEAPISDWATEMNILAVGRHTLQLGEIEVQPGLRLGMGVDDFMLFQQSGTEDRRNMNYGPLVVTSLITGPELAASWQDKVFGHIALDFGFANFNTYYAMGFDLEVAYAFTDDLYGFFGTEVTRRSLAIYMPLNGSTQQVGVVEDHINLMSIGIGWQM